MGPANVKVIHAHEFVRAQPGGVLDLETSEALLLEIARAADGFDRAEVLIDTRRAEGQLGTADLWFLADRLAKHRHAFSGRTAVLCPIERFDRARFFALLADSKGFDVEAFYVLRGSHELAFGRASLKHVLQGDHDGQ